MNDVFHCTVHVFFTDKHFLYKMYFSVGRIHLDDYVTIMPVSGLIRK